MVGDATAARVLTADGFVGPARVRWDQRGVISSIEPERGDVPDWTLVPGFVDLQVNGHGDVDVARATGADWDRLDRMLVTQGVTSWCPTLVSGPLSGYAPALSRIAEHVTAASGPAVLGVHLEGPFLTRAGAHPPAALRDPDLEWLDGLPDLVRVVTLAPERHRALDAVERLVARACVVALGHSSADARTVDAAVTRGARMVTHLFNAMPSLHHRELGLVGRALTDSRLVVSVVADGWHVDPALLPVIARSKGDGGWLLVTDAVAWAAGGTPTMPVRLQDGAPRLADGTLAGSTCRMDQAVRACVAAGIPLAEAVRAASTTPAAVVGAQDRGVIAVGRRADLVALDRELQVSRVWLLGKSQVLDL